MTVHRNFPLWLFRSVVENCHIRPKQYELVYRNFCNFQKMNGVLFHGRSLCYSRKCRREIMRFFSSESVENHASKEQELKEQEKKLKQQTNQELKKHKRVIGLLLLMFLSLYLYYESNDPNFILYEYILLFCLKYLDSELCHDLMIFLGKYGLLPTDKTRDSAYSVSSIKNLKFLNPFGIAAGFDKNGESIDGLLKLGFSFIEIGTITPKPQEGNPKPRIFRDNETKSIINSCGFNNAGCEVVAKNLESFREKQRKDPLLGQHIVGVSIGKNKDSEHIIDDLRCCIQKVGKYADYVAVNVSSPNTPGLRDYQEGTKLRKVIKSVKAEVQKLQEEKKEEGGSTNHWRNTTQEKPLVFVKLSPDLTEAQKKEIASVLLDEQVDGMIISNTTVEKQDISAFSEKKGGVSGMPLKDTSTQLISDMYKYTNRKIPIIAVGGVFSGKDALDKIEAGASVCQVYASLVFNGLKTAVKLKTEFDLLLLQKGYYNLQSAIGANHTKDK